MARADVKTGERPRGGAQATKGEGLPFTKKNYYIFLAALIVIVIGYIALAQGSITLAPILLVLGYCVVIPVAILYRDRDRNPTEGAPSGS